MAKSKDIYQKLTGSEKERFIKDMGQKEYDKLIKHLEKILKIRQK